MRRATGEGEGEGEGEGRDNGSGGGGCCWGCGCGEGGGSTKEGPSAQLSTALDRVGWLVGLVQCSL